MKINRRHVIVGATAIAGGAFLSLGNFGQPPAPAPVLSKHEYALLTEIVDMIIPATDTAGAVSAGVPLYIAMMLNDWFQPLEREQFLAGLNDIDQRSPSADFLSASPDKRSAILRHLDNQNQGDYNFFHHLKKLTLNGYYTSEIGASKELRYAAIPGYYLGCIPFKEIGRTWAT